MSIKIVNDEYLTDQIISCIEQVRTQGVGNSVKFSSNDWFMHYFRLNMPYQFTNCGLVLNRDYMPIGFGKKSRINRDHVFRLSSEKLNNIISRLPSRESPTGGRIEEGYLFNDGCPPWRNQKSLNLYMERLMAALQI